MCFPSYAHCSSPPLLSLSRAVFLNCSEDHQVGHFPFPCTLSSFVFFLTRFLSSPRQSPARLSVKLCMAAARFSSTRVQTEGLRYSLFKGAGAPFKCPRARRQNSPALVERMKREGERKRQRTRRESSLFATRTSKKMRKREVRGDNRQPGLSKLRTVMLQFSWVRRLAQKKKCSKMWRFSRACITL